MDPLIYATAGELTFAGGLVWFLYRLTIPVYRKRVRAPRVVVDTITQDSDYIGMV